MQRRTTRRELLITAAAAGGVALLDPRALGRTRASAFDLPTPSSAQLAWQRAELGVVFHWDLHVFDGKKYVQRQNWVTPIEDPQIFSPTDYDIDQWFESVKGMGARFAILTASHETGFRLWPSDVNPYSVKMLKWRDGKADIVRDFTAAARRHGIEPGIYLGCRFNSHLGVHGFEVTERATVTQAEYNRLIEAECEEIATRYGELFEIWFDGGIATPAEGGPDVLPIFEKHQPNIVFYSSNERRDARWGGSESGTVPYPCWSTVTDPLRPMTYPMMKHGDPDGEHWAPAMSDAPLRGHAGRHEWFWEPGDEAHVYPLKDLMSMYERSVGHNSTLIMGLTPDPRGRIPEVDTRRCIEWGNEIRRRYGSPLARTSGTGTVFTLDLPEARSLDRVVIREHIEHGHRIRGYALHGRVRGGDWTELGTGTCVGNRRIHAIEPTTASEVRLTVADCIDTPTLDDFAVHEVG